MQFRMDSQPGRQSVHIMDFHLPLLPLPFLIRHPSLPSIAFTSPQACHSPLCHRRTLLTPRRQSTVRLCIDDRRFRARREGRDWKTPLAELETEAQKIPPPCLQKKVSQFHRHIEKRKMQSFNTPNREGRSIRGMLNELYIWRQQWKEGGREGRGTAPWFF